MNEGVTIDSVKSPGVLTTVFTHFWFKMFATMGFTLIFFVGYLYLLKRPAAHVSIIPTTWLDGVVSFQPFALPIYLSLWFYVSLPPALMLTRSEIVAYGIRIAALCLFGLAVFYVWPNAIAPANISWEKYPSVAFLKAIDTAGNAFPSLHVATAVFSALWLYWRIGRLRLGLGIQLANTLWCVAIVYSTLAIKQHVALDVLAGAVLALMAAWATGLKGHASRKH